MADLLPGVYADGRRLKVMADTGDGMRECTLMGWFDADDPSIVFLGDHEAGAVYWICGVPRWMEDDWSGNLLTELADGLPDDVDDPEWRRRFDEQAAEYGVRFDGFTANGYALFLTAA